MTTSMTVLRARNYCRRLFIPLLAMAAATFASGGVFADHSPGHQGTSGGNSSPAIEAQLFSLDENQVGGTPVGDIVATTNRKGGLLTYEITGGNTDNLFALDPETGALATTDMLNFEAAPSHGLTVQVTDVSGKTASALITVSVGDVNEAPVGVDEDFTIPESASIGDVVGTVQVSDPDTSAPFNTLTLLELPGTTNNPFNFNTLTGELTVKDNLDHETLSLVPISFVVSDGGGLFDVVFINVIIQDINEPPTISDANLAVSESVPIGTIVGTAQASDPDDSSEPFGTLTYLKIPGPTHDSFEVDLNTGEIKTKTLLDHETAPLIIVTIGVFDGGGLSATANIFVSILDANEAPVADDAIFNVSENLPVGALVGTVSASDPDTTAPSNTLAYAITSGNVGSAFDIDPNTGELSSLTPLDLNATPIYNLAVTVTDGGGLSDIASVTVNVAEAVIPSDISEIDGANGFALTGFAPNGWVAIPGDMNGDGIDDFAIADPQAEVGGNTPGSVYVVYGTIDAAPAELDLPTLAASEGFRFDGSGSGEFTGEIINGAGDINNDGFADLILSAQGAFNAENDSTGRVYVVFGGPQIPPVVSADDLNGVNGFRVINTPLESNWAFAVSSIGDINGDGIDDFGAGSTNSSIDASDSKNGKVYAVFGRDIPNGDPDFGAVLDLTSLDATTGMVLFGAPGDFTGFFISPTGDINGDSFGDFVITSASATFPGLYVVFGNLQTDVPLPSDLPSFDLTTLDGTNGFVINAPGDNTMIGGNAGGDVNGDGHADLTVAAPAQEVNGLARAGVTYAIFGTDSNFVWPANFDLASLDGTNGFRILGNTENGNFGFPLDNRSDIDGDGLDDIVAGATPLVLPLPNDPPGPAFYYLIAGSNLPYPATIDLSALDPAVGNRIGVGNDMVVMSSAGDVNGDGLGDVLLSAGNDSLAHVVFGGDF